MKEILEKYGFRQEKITSNAYLMLSGTSGGSSSAKRAAARVAYVLLYPFIRPKDKDLLMGDSLIFVARKVR
jgi:hypothetical protein